MALLIALGMETLLTRVGFALYAAGLVRAKNSSATVFRVIVDVCITVLAFWLVGAAILMHNKNEWFSANPAAVRMAHREIDFRNALSLVPEHRADSHCRRHGRGRGRRALPVASTSV